ncbi:MAG: catalase [Thermoleophilaceae bacterium]|nr:catalase [Thermoleophilaceae bacterium]MEA2470738.1 catalase [Thermoleophilaceae bacterium]
MDIINQRFGSHGVRALHAKGTLLKGTFTATPAAAGFTRAGHMQGEPVDATVRFSNGSGEPDAPDYGPEVRGMAVKLYLPDGDRTDISAQTVPRFPVRTPDAFINLIRASAPGRGRLLRLPVFLATHPEALPALRANAPALKPPVSYATARYYAIHAFKWIDAGGGERYVRYRWLPALGEHSLSADDARSRGRDYLQDDLRERLAAGPISFTLELQVAGPGDKVDDPTAVWPDERERVNAGTLELTGLETGRETGGDVLVFDPNRVTDGIEASEDPILKFRSPAYSVSVERRISR